LTPMLWFSHCRFCLQATLAKSKPIFLFSH
jgi:hypothetical protein